MRLGDPESHPAVHGRGQTPPDDELVRFLHSAHLLGALLREILEDHFLQRRWPQHLTRVQFCCLKLVVLADGLQIGDIGRRLGLSPASASKNVQRLVDLGLLERGDVPEDRRVAVVRASAVGRWLVAEYESLKRACIAPVLASLEPERLDRLCGLLEGVCAHLTERMNPLREPCFRCAGYAVESCSVAESRGGCALAGVMFDSGQRSPV